MKAQKKTIVIDFYSVDNIKDAWIDLPKWIASFGDITTDHIDCNEPVARSEDIEIRIKALEGQSYEIGVKDVVIRGVKGEYYPCKKDVFEITYDII